jgi:hypothetical protein
MKDLVGTHIGDRCASNSILRILEVALRQCSSIRLKAYFFCSIVPIVFLVEISWTIPARPSTRTKIVKISVVFILLPFKKFFSSQRTLRTYICP